VDGTIAINCESDAVAIRVRIFTGLKGLKTLKKLVLSQFFTPKTLVKLETGNICFNI
jgi:hypothetical protein